jgi:cytochrome c-type biogenesis protein CcmE
MIELKKKTRVLLIAGILVVTVGFLSWGMLTLFVDPYLSVDAVVENPDDFMGRTIQVKGKLQANSLSISASNVTFVMEGDTHTLTVLVLGDLPNMQDGQDVVAIGELVSANLIRASQILAQCPSKYETNSTAA